MDTMSNLGLHQTMTTLAKKVGGPAQLAGIVAGGGVVVGSVATKAFDWAKSAISAKRAADDKVIESLKVYEIKQDGISNEGLQFCVGDKFRVLERDGIAVLIERLEDESSPYVVSADFLANNSDYTV